MKFETVFGIFIIIGFAMAFYFVGKLDNNEITYSIKGCSDDKVTKINSAFNEIKKSINNSTGFIKVFDDSAEISISCKGKQSLGKEQLITTLGEATQNYLGATIKDSEITFYYEGDYKDYSPNCLDNELHEILHVLGIEHIDDENSIMYPFSEEKCLNKIDEEIIDTLNEYY